MNDKVCILTTVHETFDIRIFYKEAQSLVKSGYQVTLLAQHEQDAEVAGVSIVALPKVQSRIRRIFFLPVRAFFLALQQAADIYHIHDPELLLIGLLIKRFTKSQVIYDAHEDYSSTVWTREWIPELLKPFLSEAINKIELFLGKKLDGIITADPFVARKFSNVHEQVVTLLNVPPRKLIERTPSFKKQKIHDIVHIGSLSKSRGVRVLYETAEQLAKTSVDFKLHVFVKSTPQEILNNLQDEIRQAELDSVVEFHDTVPYDQMLSKLTDFDIGLITFLDMEKFHKNIATKMFDYMAAGLAIVSSDLPPQRAVIETVQCGYLVTPNESHKFVEAIIELIQDPDTVNQMGKKGWSAFQETYCWEEEEPKLIQMYSTLLNRNSPIDKLSTEQYGK